MEEVRRWYITFSSTQPWILLCIYAALSHPFILVYHPFFPKLSHIFIPPAPLQARWLYPTLPRCFASLPTNHSSLQSIPMSHPAAAGFPQPPPLVAGEGGTDGEVLEDRVSAEEVHSKRQIIRSHPFQFCSTETGATFQLPDASFLRRTWGENQDRILRSSLNHKVKTLKKEPDRSINN